MVWNVVILGMVVMSAVPVPRIACYDLNISPVHVEIPWTVPTSVMVVTCTAADVSLTGCQFMWRDYWGSNGPLLDLSQGPQSRADPSYLNGSFIGYGYHGRGLSAGDCGLAMRVSRVYLWMVGCRVRADNGGWAYAWMDVTVSVSNRQASRVTPKEAVVVPGEEARFVLNAQGALKECQWYLPGVSGYINFRDGARSPQSGGRHRYHGAGLQSGDCGLALNVTEANNGAVVVFAASLTGHIPYNRFIVVIVARPPSVPILSIAREGPKLSATCVVAASRPVASLVWFLDGEVIRRDFRDDSPSGLLDEWRWPWMSTSVEQTVTLDLEPRHDGRVLKCSTSHVTLARPLEATHTISFAEKCPLLVSAMVDITCFFEGQPTNCSQLRRPGSSSANLSGRVPGTDNCTLLSSTTVDISCFFEGQPTNCSQPQRAGSSANLACKPGFSTSDEVNYGSINCTASGEWDKPVFACSPVPSTENCPPLSSATVDIFCFFGGNPTNCSQLQRAGSSANLDCKAGFHIYDVITYRTIHCMDSGEWNKPVFMCSPDCGKRKSNSVTPLIAGGEVATVGEFPWHVAVFEQDGATAMNLICSGSLISPNIVISAAHCYWSGQFDALKNASLYRVAAGKSQRAWVHADDDRTVQRRDVTRVLVPPGYHGRRANFQSDVAVLRLTEPVDITPDVNLICVDWGNQWERAQLTPGNNGSVAGWGYTDAGDLSDRLMKVDLPLVDHDTCYRALEDDMKPLLTMDKICAGYANRSTGACRGDSGGGLVFRLAGVERHYLRAVVSLAFTPFDNRAPCYSQLYTAFTIVSHHHGWMREHIE